MMVKDEEVFTLERLAMKGFLELEKHISMIHLAYNRVSY